MELLVQGLLGSHNICGFVSTWARSNDTAQDDKDHHGRWKNSGQVSDGCDDVQLDHIDAKVAATLCMGGVCNCVVVEPSCTNDWIVTNVAPQTKEVYGEGVALLFGRALLWLAFSSLNEIMPPTMLERICGAYTSTQQGQEAANPVVKQLVSVTGHDATVHLTEIVMNELGVNATENPNGAAPDHPPVPVTPEHHVGEN